MNRLKNSDFYYFWNILLGGARVFFEKILPERSDICGLFACIDLFMKRSRVSRPQISDIFTIFSAYLQGENIAIFMKKL